jgi:hypothetical protein
VKAYEKSAECAPSTAEAAQTYLLASSAMHKLNTSDAIKLQEKAIQLLLACGCISQVRL